MYDGLNSHMKWKLLKAEIRAVSQQFSRFIQSNKHNHTTNLRDSLNDLGKQLSNDPSDKYLQNEINKTKKELEISELEKTRGAQVRARIKWAEEEERSTKFFLNLEKSKAQGNTIHRLVKDDGSFLNTSGEIIKKSTGTRKVTTKKLKRSMKLQRLRKGMRGISPFLRYRNRTKQKLRRNSQKQTYHLHYKL